MMPALLEQIKAHVAGKARLAKTEADLLRTVREAAKALGYELTENGAMPTRDTYKALWDDVTKSLDAVPKKMPKPTPESKGYGCPYCERVFPKKINLGRHVSTMHKKQFAAWRKAQ